MNVNDIIEEQNAPEALKLLIEAKRLCKLGNVIELMDLLCPEDSVFYTTGGKRKKR